jgi:hypothetical protein
MALMRRMPEQCIRISDAARDLPQGRSRVGRDAIAARVFRKGSAMTAFVIMVERAAR